MSAMSDTPPPAAAKPKSKARHQARRLLLQALYQWQLTGASAAEIDRQFREEQPVRQADLDYFSELLRRIITLHGELDQALAPLLDRPLEQLTPVERAILLIGSYELMHCIELPYPVVINEAIELAKSFAAPDSHKYVNGVLDRIAAQFRRPEVEARRR